MTIVTDVPRKSFRVTFAGGNGFSLAGIVDRPDSDAPAPVVVFSHCFTCNKDLKAIVRISRTLADQGVAVLRYDMTGLGGSEGEFSHTNFTTNLADLNAAIDFAAAQIGPVTALVGHSFGGAASLAVAAQRRAATIAAVVTLAAPSDTVHLARLLAKLDPQIERVGVGKVEIGGRQWTIERQMLDDFRTHDLPALITQINVPTMLVHSPLDATVGFDHALRIMALVQATVDSNATVSLVTLPGADHLLSQPDDIELVAAMAAAFVHRYQ